ncbi:MAG: ATP synthase F0 subunit B [Candidatus Binatia bacterium]
MIHLDYSIVYQMVLFVVLWLILNKLLFQPYLRLLEEREHKTTGAQHDSVDLEHEGAKLKAQFDEQIAQGQAVGYAAKEAINQDARQQREKILGQARDAATRTLDQVRQEVAAAMEQEKRLAAAEVSAVAADMVHKVLGRRVG